MKILRKEIFSVLAIFLALGSLIIGQAAINTVPAEVQLATERGKVSSHLIEEFGPNTMGKAIIRKIMEREKPGLIGRDQARGKDIFNRIQHQPIVVSLSSAELQGFMRRGLAGPLENPLLKPKLNITEYNEQINRASGVHFPSILDVQGEENHELKLWNSLRPKHAYVLPNDLLGKSIHNGKSYQPPREGLELWSGMENEGNMILVLKDHVKEFSTFTFGSLTKDLPQKDVGSRVFTFFDRAAGDPVKKEVPWEARYIEVQIWGEVSLADVKEVWVSTTSEAKVLENAKQMGVPVFKFKRRSVDSEDRRGLIYQRLGMDE